jgi:hypothetical protein
MKTNQLDLIEEIAENTRVIKKKTVDEPEIKAMEKKEKRKKQNREAQKAWNTVGYKANIEEFALIQERSNGNVNQYIKKLVEADLYGKNDLFSSGAEQELKELKAKPGYKLLKFLRIF